MTPFNKLLLISATVIQFINDQALNRTTEKSLFNSYHEQDFSYPKHAEKAIGYMKQLGTEVKQPHSEAGHAPSPSTEVKNDGCHASIPPIVLHDMHRDKFTSTYFNIYKSDVQTVFMYNKISNVLI